MLFTCDLYNEGVDLPFVDTLLLLRPTQSATLFLQQLGRGLRLHPHKPTCLVLDFIGQHRDEFRFDAVLPAFTGVPRPGLRQAVEDGFPYLPSGCTLQLDAVARDQVLRSLRASVGGAKRLTAELRELAMGGAPPRLAEFLAATGRDLADVYTAGGWTTLQRLAGLVPPAPDAAAVDDLSRRLGMLQHIDEPARLRAYRDLVRAAAAGATPALSDLERRRLVMLESQLHHRGVLRAAEAAATYLAGQPAIVDELEQLREVLEDKVTLPGDVRPVPEWPLALHRHYSRREIAVAVGCHLRQVRQGLLPHHPLPRLRDQPRPLPLGVPGRRQRHAAVGQALRRERHQRLAVLPAGADGSGGGVLLPRGDPVRVARGGSADRDHVGAGDRDPGGVDGAVCDVEAGVGVAHGRADSCPGAGSTMQRRTQLLNSDPVGRMEPAPTQRHITAAPGMSHIA